jgi:hypothetical protein
MERRHGRSRDWKEAKPGRRHSVVLAAIAGVIVYGYVLPHGLTFVD